MLVLEGHRAGNASYVINSENPTCSLLLVHTIALLSYNSFSLV